MSTSQIFTLKRLFSYIHDRKILREIFSRGGFLEIFSYGIRYSFSSGIHKRVNDTRLLRYEIRLFRFDVCNFETIRVNADNIRIIGSDMNVLHSIQATAGSSNSMQATLASLYSI